jgi:hypothetical protein
MAIERMDLGESSAPVAADAVALAMSGGGAHLRYD